MEKAFITIGRVLLGGYFLFPGISKIPTYSLTIEYMTLHSIPFASILLPITIIIQLTLGSTLIIGYRIKESALVWNDYPNTDAGHELQNFFKNLGIFAGLLALSASNNISQWRLLKHS